MSSGVSLDCHSHSQIVIKGMPDCSVYEGASTANFVFLVLITIGIFVSYLPQYHRIYVKRTSEGLSRNFLLLGSCSSLFTLTNIILVSSRARQCCYSGKLSPFNCVNAQLNMIQIGVQCVSAILILVFVLVLTRSSVKQDKVEYSKIVQVGKYVALHATVSLFQIVFAFLGSSKVLYGIANINGLLSTLLTIVKYVPQIHTTYKLKHPGTLSIGMMCIQTPGGVLFTITLMLTKGSHWSSWISYMVAAILQGTLLGLCFYYEYYKNHGLTAELGERRAIDRIVDENVGDTSRQNEPSDDPTSSLLH